MDSAWCSRYRKHRKGIRGSKRNASVPMSRGNTMPRQLPSWWAASQCDSAVRLAWRTGQRSMGSGRRKRTDREQVRLALGSRGDGDRMPRRVQAHGFSTSIQSCKTESAFRSPAIVGPIPTKPAPGISASRDLEPFVDCLPPGPGRTPSLLRRMTARTSRPFCRFAVSPGTGVIRGNCHRHEGRAREESAARPWSTELAVRVGSHAP